MTERCAKCGNKAREGLRSPLGDVVCQRCSDNINGAVMGGLAAGLPGAVVGPGLLGWIRGALDPKKKRAASRDRTEDKTPDPMA